MKTVTKAASLGFAMSVWFFSTISSVHADYIYVSFDSGMIMKFDAASGNGRVFSTFAPRHIALDGNGNLYGCGGDMIYKLDPRGNASVFGTGGYESSGLAFDDNGDLYVANWFNGGDILKFDSSGHSSAFLWGLPEPINVAFDTNGNLYVANWYGGIQKFDPNGRYLSTWGAGLDEAYGLAFDSSGNLYVGFGASGYGSHIAKFDLSGNETIVTSNLHYPQSFAFDSNGNLYVADWNWDGSGTVEKFDPSGYETTFASGLGSPEGIAIAPAPNDSDLDGVPDDQDECPNTPAGAIIDNHGCSIHQLVPCAGPTSGGTWKNHGQYVSAIVHVSAQFLADGLITEDQRDRIVRDAAQSSCGKR